MKDVAIVISGLWLRRTVDTAYGDLSRPSWSTPKAETPLKLFSAKAPFSLHSILRGDPCYLDTVVDVNESAILSAPLLRL